MGTDYPASLDTTANFPTQATLAAHELFTDPHSQLHGNVGDAIRAVETYVGTAVSPAAGSLTYRLNNIETYSGAPVSNLTPKSVSSNTTAAVGDLIVIDSGATPPIITLPTAPADKSLIAVTWNSWAGPGGTVSIVRGGSDSIQGGNTLYLRFLRQGYQLQYWSAQTKWLAFPYLDYDSTEGTLARVASPTFTGVATSPAWKSTGLSGANSNASRYVGGVNGANPGSGTTWIIGDYVVDRGIGGYRVCTTGGTSSTAVWQSVGPEGRTGAYRAITATATLATTDYVVAVDSTSAAVTVNLPTAVGITGKEYRIKRTNSGANDVTIDPNSTQTIDGATTLVLSGQWDSAVIVSNGANWLRV